MYPTEPGSISKFSSNSPYSSAFDGLWKVIPQQKEMLQTLVTSSKSLTPRTQTKGAVRPDTWWKQVQLISSNFFPFLDMDPDLVHSFKVHSSWTNKAAKDNMTTIGLWRITAARPHTRDSELVETELKLRNLYFKNDLPRFLVISQVWEALIQQTGIPDRPPFMASYD